MYTLKRDKYTKIVKNHTVSTDLVTKISLLFPDPHRMFPRNIFSESSEKIAGTVPAILIFTNSIRIFPLLS